MFLNFMKICVDIKFQDIKFKNSQGFYVNLQDHSCALKFGNTFYRKIWPIIDKHIRDLIL